MAREFGPRPFSPDGKKLLTGCLDGLARFWGRPPPGTRSIRPSSMTVRSGSWPSAPTARTIPHRQRRPDGAALGCGRPCAGRLDLRASGCDRGRGDQPRRRMGPDRGRGFPRPGSGSSTSAAARGLGVEHREAIHAVAFGPDGKDLPHREPRRHRSTVGTRPPAARSARPCPIPARSRAVAISPDGKIILTGCADCRARLWDSAFLPAVGPAPRTRRRSEYRGFQPRWQGLPDGESGRVGAALGTPSRAKTAGASRYVIPARPMRAPSAAMGRGSPWGPPTPAC